jgi:hypothetical protein
LHIGHWENFIMGYQICFVLFTVLVTALAVVALDTTRENAFRSGVIASVLLMLIALTGGSGLAVILPVAAWLVFLATSVWRSGEKGRAALLMLLAMLPVAYLGLYFIDYHKPADHPDISMNPLEFGPRAAATLSLAPGVGLRPVWWVVCAAELVLGGWTIAILIRRGRAEALSTAGLIAVAAGIGGLALVIGIARAGWEIHRILDFVRYSLLVWPLLAMAYLVWVKLGYKWVPIALCIVAALAFPGNMATGMVNGAASKATYTAIETDAAFGLSAEQIVKRQFPDTLQAGREDQAILAIPLLRKARIGIFAR